MNQKPFQLSAFVAVLCLLTSPLASYGEVPLPATPTADSPTSSKPAIEEIKLEKEPTPVAVEKPAAVPQGEKIALREDASEPPVQEVEGEGSDNQIQVEAVAPDLGETVHIDINSDDLNYDSKTGVYTVNGEVYIIVPEKRLEVLADSAKYDPKMGSMVAVGNVFIIRDKKIIGSQETQFDLKKNLSFYKEPRTIFNGMRISAKSAARTDEYTVLDHGRLVLTTDGLSDMSDKYRRQGGVRIGQGSYYSMFSASRGKQLLSSGYNMLDNPVLARGGDYLLDDRLVPDTNFNVVHKPISPHDIASADYLVKDAKYRFKLRTITIKRGKKGFDKIYLTNTRLKYQDLPAGYIPAMTFGFNEKQKFLTYLGPEMGYDQDNGGWFFAPGWDKRFLNGWLSVSPSVSYGGGRRLSSPESVDPQFGVGVVSHFRSPDNRTDFSYNTTFRDPILYFDEKVFRNQTRLRGGWNHYINNGFFGAERPRYISELSDMEEFTPFPRWSLRTYLSAGFAKDNFFPNRRNVFFVAPTSTDPRSEGRFQLQAQLRNNEPLIRLGEFGSVGALGQTRLAAYTGGNFYGIFQGGPYLNLLLGPLYSQTTYLYTQTVGSSPFVFDTYYSGRNNVQTINAIDLGKYVTIGSLQNLNLDQDNARRDLLVEQRFFLTAGSKSVKFSIGYDTIQRRTFFGITLNPQGGQVVTDFDRMNIYEPGYNPGWFNQPPSMLPQLTGTVPQ